MGERFRAEGTGMVDTAIPLSDALANGNGLVRSDAMLRFDGGIKVFANRLWVHAWPWGFMAGLGLMVLLGRAVRRDRIGFTIPMLFVVVSVASIVCIVVVRRVVVSKGSQLALVALPPEAVALLGVDHQVVTRDGGGTIPRHPLIASESGLQIDIDGAHPGPLNLRDRGISIELTASRSGLLSRCVLCLGERCVTVRVRGRLQLNRPVLSTAP
jgi:hypothetical protein